MIKKFEGTGLIMDSKLPVRHRTGRSLDDIAAVSESVAESPGTSLRYRSQHIGHLEKHHVANSHERSASACLQNSTDTRTQTNKPYAVPRIF